MTHARACELLKAYDRLVISIASEGQFWLPEDSLLDRDDLISIGQTLMLQACESFEEWRGAKMSTWVAKLVRQGLGNVVRDARSISRTDADKRKVTGATPERRSPLRLDEPLRLDGCGSTGSSPATLLDRITIEQVEKRDDTSPFAQAVISMQRDWLYRAIDHVLNERERRYILAELDGATPRPLTPAEVGDQDGLSRQRVEQVIARAKEKHVDQYRLEQRQKRRRRRVDA